MAMMSPGFFPAAAHAVPTAPDTAGAVGGQFAANHGKGLGAIAFAGLAPCLPAGMVPAAAVPTAGRAAARCRGA